MRDLEEQKGLEQIVRQFMKDQLKGVAELSKEDNSFAFLEKSTLHLLLTYLLSQDKGVPEEQVNGQFELLVLKQLDDLIEDSKVQFEELMNLLKKLS